MRHEERVVCETCGTEFVSRLKGAKYCSHVCANQKTVKKQKQEKLCPHNSHVVCGSFHSGKCGKCGWNPVVAQGRSAMIREKLKEAMCNG